ncbi:MAG: 50S ribosomal protein L6 [bacterium]|nr:50S ribosomal protein L6 [bacterium]
MSRVGKKYIAIPSGVTVRIEPGLVSVKGPKGELSFKVPSLIEVKEEEGKILVSPANKDENAFSKQTASLWGVTRTIISNMVQGTTEGFQKKLEIEGVGYKASKQGEELSLQMGYSHPVLLKAPEGITFEIEKNVITVSGADKEKVGQFAATIKRIRSVEPYKGKGIRYQGEYVRRKLGKKAATGTAS